ncbi:DNA-directed RNA polymerase subunit beta [Dendrobium catenatum]|uniref:DNA-directed RNA polymerase subunit beta n=1 Tax=Dendrobium catenatum TaxID=906689 RepID=A0A2I0VTI3_9ASPA|nr:DNA-directed RNA polymerase subunit beta [Dendrobium catenatum]
MLGYWIETCDILIGKLTAQTTSESSYAPEDRLLRVILGIQVSIMIGLRLFDNGSRAVVHQLWSDDDGLVMVHW